MLTQKLNQIRIASAGGRYPLNVPEDEKETVEESNDVKGKKKTPKEIVYSDFAFEGKLKVLLKDLLAAREEDPTCKFYGFAI